MWPERGFPHECEVHTDGDSINAVIPLIVTSSCRLATPDGWRTLTVGMANMVLSLLSSAWFPLDLSAHQDALLLSGNLLAGG